MACTTKSMTRNACHGKSNVCRTPCARGSMALSGLARQQQLLLNLVAGHSPEQVALTITKWSSINQVTATPKHPLVRKYCTGYWHWQAYTPMCSAPPLTLLKSTTGPGTVKRQAGRHTDQPHSCRQDNFVSCAATTALLCKSSTACGCAQTVTIHTS